MPLSKETEGIITVILGIVFVLFFLSIPFWSIKKKSPEAWGDQQIGMGPYPQDHSWGDGFVASYMPKTTGAMNKTKGLIEKWYDFVGQLSPDVAGAIYALFDDLQTPQSIQYYGLSAGMVSVLQSISGLLDHPEQLKTLEDVNLRFAKAAIKAFSRDVDTVPTDSLYKNPKAYGVYEDVY